MMMMLKIAERPKGFVVSIVVGFLSIGCTFWSIRAILNPSEDKILPGRRLQHTIHSIRPWIKVIEFLVQCDDKVHTKDIDSGWTAFDRTCFRFTLEIFRLVADGPVNPDKEEEEETTILHIACERGNLEIASFLMENGADDVNIQNKKNGKTPLHLACEQENLQSVVFLMENGADANVKNTHGKTPLHLACERGDLEITNVLLENGADVNVRTNDGWIPLHFACERFENVDDEIARLLVRHGADVNAKNNNEETPFHLACHWDHLEIIPFLVKNAGADVNATQQGGRTALHDASMEGDLAKVKLLIQIGANVNAKSNSKKTPLHYACCLDGHLEIAKLLLQNGGDINARDNLGETPLYGACRNYNNDCLDLVQLLIENGAIVDDESRLGPFHLACQNGLLEVVKYFLLRRAGAKDDTCGSTQRLEGHWTSGVTPLQLACEGNHVEIVWLLVRRNPCLVVEP